MSSNVKADDHKSSFSKIHNALLNFIKSSFVGSVIFEPVDTAFDYAMRQTKGDLKFPFISLYNSPSIEISALNNNYSAIKEGTPMYRQVPVYDKQGNQTGFTNKVSKNVQNLYINIEYQLDIWATTRRDVEDVMQELLFLLYDKREVSINYYGQELYFTFTIGDNIVDNSDLVNYDTNNKIYRMTLNVLVTGSIYRTTNYFNVLEPKIDIDYLEKEEV